MNTDAVIRRPAISGIESVAFGIIGLAGLVSILFAATPILDMTQDGSPDTAVSYRSNAIPSSPNVAFSGAQSIIYPRAI